MGGAPDGARGSARGTVSGWTSCIVDDHPAVRAGLRGLIEDEDDLRVAATAATAREGFEAIADARPAVALVDLHLPDDDGLSLCLRTRALPAAAAGGHLLRVRRRRRSAVLAAIAGADAVLPKSAPPRAAARRAPRASRGRRWTRARCGRSARASTPDDLAILGMLAHGVGERGDRRDARARARAALAPRRARDAGRLGRPPLRLAAA